MDDRRSSQRYHRIKNRLFFLNVAINILALLLFSASGLSIHLKEAIGGISRHLLVVNGLYALVFGVYLSLVGLPLGFYEGFLLERRFGLSNQNLLSWLKDALKNLALGSVVLIIAVEALYLFLGRFPQSWWLWATGFWLLLTVAIARLTPSLLIPLFFKYRRLENPGLQEKLFSLLEKCRVKIRAIFYIDFSRKSKKANAFICGIANNRRLVLTDTLLKEFSEDEIAAVVAHEAAHYRHHDIIKLIMANTAVSFLSFYLMALGLKDLSKQMGLTRIDDIAFLPVLALGIFLLGLIMLPAINGFSRSLEKRADWFCLEKTRDPESFISLMTKLGELNLADFCPPPAVEWLLYDHPPIAKRIKLAEGFKPGAIGGKR